MKCWLICWGIDHDPLLLQSPGIHGLQVEALGQVLSKSNKISIRCHATQLLKPRAYPDLSVLKKPQRQNQWKLHITYYHLHHPNCLRCQLFASSTNEGPFKFVVEGCGYMGCLTGSERR